MAYLATPGIRLTHVPKPPHEIKVKLKYQYFSLNQSGAAWASVQKSRNLAAYVPSDLPNPSLELLHSQNGSENMSYKSYLYDRLGTYLYGLYDKIWCQKHRF